jgi:hypothetical protein
MNEKTDEPAGIRAHLLGIEPPDVGRMRQLQLEILMVFQKPLTRSTRVAWIVSLIASVVFGGASAIRLIHSPPADAARVATGWLFVTAMLIGAIRAVWVLRRGFVDSRQLTEFKKAFVPAALIVAIMLIAQAIEHPAIPALGWALFGMIWLVIAIGMLLYDRVTAAELTTREAMLRMELRMAELVEGRRHE